MKLISFTVPCYNSSAYMNKCIDSLLLGGDEVEIIIVNDGSMDDTASIADDYARKYPNIIKVIHKTNGGHGSGVNVGAAAATGRYFKVVDSDDWVDADAYKTLLDTVREHVAENKEPDLYITNFVYDHTCDNTMHVSSYENKLKPNCFTDFRKMKRFHFSHMMLMHALMYRLDRYRASDTVLPEHTFYVDNIFAYKPLPLMRSVYYLPVDFYHYFIGRSDQSVNKEVFVGRYDQQIRVMTAICDAYSYETISMLPRGLRRYMTHCLDALLTVTLYFTCLQDTLLRREAVKKFWAHIKEHDKKMYRHLRYFSYSVIVNFLPWGMRNRIMNFSYNVINKRVRLG